MTTEEFEPATPASERPQSHFSDRAATGKGSLAFSYCQKLNCAYSVGRQ
jgi:hypothetical protein